MGKMGEFILTIQESVDRHNGVETLVKEDLRREFPKEIQFKWAWATAKNIIVDRQRELLADEFGAP